MSLILVTGVPGSGKTTLASALARRLGCAFLRYENPATRTAWWATPGGGVEAGEGDEQTLRRIRMAVAHPEPLEAPRTVVVDTTRRVAIAALARTLRAETRGRHGFAAP